MIKDSAYSISNVSVDAIISLGLGVFSIICMVGGILISYLYDGKGPAAVGLLGIGGLMMAFVGICFGVAAWKSQDGGLLMKRIAVIVNTLVLLAALILYILGWVM